jgi:3-oxoacyl-[acyl-carrier-protein] synthase I
VTAMCVLRTSACTAVGLSAASAAAAVRSGIAGFSAFEGAQDRLGEPAIVAAPPGIAGFANPAEAIAEMAVAAVSELGLDGPVPVMLALPEARPGLASDLGRQVAARLAERVPAVRVAFSEGAGHAGGGSALRQAGAWLDGRPDATVVVVGADSYVHAETLSWLDSNRQLHAPYNAWGFIPGAAAGACLLCHPRLAQARRELPCAMIEAVALDHEEIPIKTDGVCLGWAMSRVVESLVGGRAGEVVFDAFYCDQNGETYRADEVGFMLARAAGRFRDAADFVAPADCWGDVGAASIPLFVALAAEAAERGYAAGPVSLLLAGSESGLRAGVALRTPMKAE